MSPNYSDDPDLHGLYDLVHAEQMDPAVAMAGVAVQFFQPKIHDVTPDVRDPEFWKLVGECIVKTIEHPDKLIEVIGSILKILAVAKAVL